MPMEAINHAAIFTSSLPQKLLADRKTDRASGIWEHIKQAVSQAAHRNKIGPETPAVRGSVAAAETLTSLALTEIPAKKWTIFIGPSGPKIRPGPDLNGNLTVSGTPTLASELLPDIDIWFDPGGVTPISSLFRQWFGQSAYPIVAMQHTMSLHSLLSDYFLPIISSATYPWDSLVCSTQCSAKAVSKLIENTRETCRRWAQNPSGFAGRIDVIPLPIDTDYFSPGDKDASRSLLGLDRKAFIILYMGSLAATKADLAPFLIAFKHLFAESRTSKPMWVIAGPSDPRYLAHLKQEIRQMELVESIVFRDYVTVSEKLHLYRAADVFFSPSDTIQESFGLAPVEAMSCGLPQVVSDWNGYRETVIDGTTGFRIRTLWSACDSELRTSGFCLGSDHDHIALGQSVAIDLGQWARAMRELLGSSDLRNEMSFSSRRSAVTRFSGRVIADRHCSLWSELISMYKSAQPAVVPDRRTLHTAHYSECFSHYASKLLDGSDRVRANPNVGWPDRYLQDASAFVNQHSDLIDLEICKQIFNKSAGFGCEIADLYPSHPTFFEQSRYLRHVLWLIKQGLLEVLPE
ncbi:MAG TPA: glycosyltransferase family 4 protein [Bryobacteraceae bacterium]|nr:glycosyltransferase family 4 protein [Bryobacteraceae bacterium]